MSNQLVHTPEGVRDIYGEEYAKKLKVQEQLHNKLQAYGYHDIQTPTFEYFDVFSKEIGTTPSKELYKFFDKEGSTLVLRPDFTPSMARCAAKYFTDDMPIRFTYVGNTFTNTSNLQGKLKEVTQMGVELIGDDSVEADAEMISMVVEALLQTGLEEFQISVGQMDYFKGICAACGMDEDTELVLREYISSKNYFAAEELLLQKEIRHDYREVLLKITDLYGTVDALKEAKELVTNERSLNAINRLESLYKVLCAYGVEKYVTFDLGLLSKYNYYTGVVFKAYTYGVGDAIITGGRYDNLLQQFGKKAPAIGAAIVVDDLLIALSRQKIKTDIYHNSILLVYTPETYADALTKAKALRVEGSAVEMVLLRADKLKEDYEAFAAKNMHKEVLFI